MVTIGQQIKEARERKGWTQDQLAQQLKVSQQSVAQWESGKASPRGHRLAEVQKVLDLPTSPLDPYIEAGLRTLYVERATGASGILRAEGTFEDARMFAHQAMQRFAQALPEHLRGHVEQRAEFGPLRYSLDYFSDALAVEIKAFGPRDMLAPGSTPGSPIWIPPRSYMKDTLFNLASLRQITMAASPDRDFIVLLIVGEGGDVSSNVMNRYRLEASLHGINLETVETPEKAADRVVRLEMVAEQISQVIEHEDDDKHFDPADILGNLPDP